MSTIYIIQITTPTSFLIFPSYFTDPKKAMVAATAMATRFRDVQNPDAALEADEWSVSVDIGDEQLIKYETCALISSESEFFSDKIV